MPERIALGGNPHLLDCAYAATQNGIPCGIACWKPGEHCPLGVPDDHEPATVEDWLSS